MSITTSIDGKMNTKKWNSNDKSERTLNQHKKKKKWYHTNAPMRTKWRWNKKQGTHEISKKGSKDNYYWCD